MKIFTLSLIVVLYFFKGSKAAAFPKNDDGELIFAHTLCRHGDRNIFFVYKKDPLAPVENWPGGYYQLTNEGKDQHYELGKFLHDRYYGNGKLIGDGGYSPDKVYIRATDKDRVLMSAEANMAGFFQPEESQRFTHELNWHPIPVHTVPLEYDYTLATSLPCKRYDTEMWNYTKDRNDDYFKLFNDEKNKELIKKLENYSELPLTNLTYLVGLYDTLYVEKLKNMTLADWAEEVMDEESGFRELADHWFAIFSHTTYQKRIKSGFLLKEILERFENKINSNITQSLWMYFAHDITITNMLNSLENYKEIFQPSYASCLLFELYNSTEQYKEPYVKILYKDGKNEDKNAIPVRVLEKCDNSDRCPLEKLKTIYKDILPTETYENECALRKGEVWRENPESQSL